MVQGRKEQNLNPDILDDPNVKAWLDEFPKKSTKKQYRSRIVKFFETVNKLPKDLNDMDTKAIRKLVLDFQNIMVERGAANNGILSIITAFRSYIKSIDKDAGKLKDRLVNAEADNSSHIFTNGDLRLLFEVGNTFEKALIATAVSEGWEISAFLKQDKEVVEKRLAHGAQNNEKYIFFCNTRGKTGESRFCVLNPLAIEWLTKYLAVRKDDDERLFPITADGVQKMLYRLAEQSGLKTTGNLRFHNIRKWLMSRLSRCGFNEFQIKYIMGKSIGVSDSTYLQTLQTEIEEKYPVVYNDYLNIVPTAASKEIKQQSEIINRLIETMTKMQATIDEQAKDVQWLKKIAAVLDKPLSKEEIEEIKRLKPTDAE